MGFRSMIVSENMEIKWSRKFKRKYGKILKIFESGIITKYAIKVYLYPFLIDDIWKEVKKQKGILEDEYEKYSIFVIQECGCIVEIIMDLEEIQYIVMVKMEKIKKLESRCYGWDGINENINIRKRENIEKMEKNIKTLWDIIYEYEKKYMLLKDEIKKIKRKKNEE
jgi:hypothetical protein